MDYVANKAISVLKFLNKTTIKGLFAACLYGSSASYAVETVYWVDNQSGVAMAGYDPISFFLRGEGGYGDYRYEYYWSGAVWRFQNEGNLEAFREYPLIYAPQYGGFDALRMSANVSVTPDPYFSDVYENRLYLFHSKKNLDKWLVNKKKYVRAAQKNWKAMHVYEVFKNFDAPEVVEEMPAELTEADADKQKALNKMSEIDRKNEKAELEAAVNKTN